MQRGVEQKEDIGTSKSLLKLRLPCPFSHLKCQWGEEEGWNPISLSLPCPWC